MCADNHVSEFSCCATFATINLTIEDDSGADTVGRQHEYEITGIANFRPAEPKLCERNRVCVVVNRYGQADTR